MGYVRIPLSSVLAIAALVLVSGCVGQAGGPAAEVSDAERFGTIERNEVWSGTIRVTGDIIVRPGATLTIQPGTTVLVSANSDRQNLMAIPFWLKRGIAQERDQYIHQGEPYRDEEQHVTIWIDGTLNATGTAERRIVIRSDSPEPTRYDWNTLHVSHGALSYAEVRDYRAMDLRSGTRLSNSELHNVGECPICIHDSTDVRVEGNRVYDAGHELVDISRSSPTIVDNRFGPSPRFANPGGGASGWGGIIVGHGSDAVLRGNVIEGTDDAVTFFEEETYARRKDQMLAENTFKNNTENVVLHLNPA